MRTYLVLENGPDYQLPERFLDDDVRYPSALVGHFLDAFTAPGDIVFDPFAGFGTTLYVAEAMGRIPYGLEFEQDRVDFIRSRLKNKNNIICGDARRLDQFDLPPLDFSMTSPPYTTPQDPEDALSAYRTHDGNYQRYLQELQDIYKQIGKLLKPGSRVIIEAANIKHELETTPLAWHIAEQVSQVLYFEGEIVVCRDNYGYGYDHSYCLLFTK